MNALHFGVRSIFVVAMFVVGTSCASSQSQPDVDFEVDGSEIRLALSEEVARSAVEGLLGSSLECDGDIDGDLRELLTALDRGGPKSRATRRDGETTLDARRRGARLDLELRESGPGKIEATMPWVVAECLLGRKTSVERAVSSSIKVKVSNPNGRNFSFTIQ